jgi:hypothetical protein
MKHYGHFDRNGKLQCESFTKELRALKEKGVPVVLTCAEFKEKRSSQANRYYWGICVELIHRALNEGGIEISREGTHELLRVRFLSVDHPIGTDGEFVTRVRSTTELDKEEFGAYIERCVQFASEYLNVVIPPPGEQMSLIEQEQAA